MCPANTCTPFPPRVRGRYRSHLSYRSGSVRQPFESFDAIFICAIKRPLAQKKQDSHGRRRDRAEPRDDRAGALEILAGAARR